MAKTILEQDLGDLEPVEEPINTDQPIDDLDLEEITGGDEEMGEKEYQYTLTTKQAAENEEGAPVGDGLEPSFTFILTPREAEEETPLEGEEDLEAIEDTSTDISAAQAPPASTPPAEPLPESAWGDLEPITEQEALPPAAPPAPAAPADPAAPVADTPPPAEEPLPEEEPELEEVAPVELSEEDLKSFIEGGEFEIKFSIDEETEFNLDEAIDYLKLYPDTEVFVTIKGDVDEFKTKLDEFTSGKEEATAEAGAEEQNVMVDDQGQSLELSNNSPAAPTPPQVPTESFSIFNIKGKNNLPDGIYIGHLAENRLYGRIDLKLTPKSLVVAEETFSLAEKVDIEKARAEETIPFYLKENEVEKFVKLLEENADIRVKL